MSMFSKQLIVGATVLHSSDYEVGALRMFNDSDFSMLSMRNEMVPVFEDEVEKRLLNTLEFRRGLTHADMDPNLSPDLLRKKVNALFAIETSTTTTFGDVLQTVWEQKGGEENVDEKEKTRKKLIHWAQNFVQDALDSRWGLVWGALRRVAVDDHIDGVSSVVSEYGVTPLCDAFKEALRNVEERNLAKN